MTDASPSRTPIPPAVSGRLGAEKRWSDPANRRVVRIESLSIPERRLVLDMVAAAEAAMAAEKPGSA